MIIIQRFTINLNPLVVMGQLHPHYPWKKNSNMKPTKTSRITRIHDHHIDESENNKLGLQDLNQELLEEILLRVPLKSRTKLKSVSKSWRASIASLRLSTPLRTSSGLVVFLKNSVMQFIQLGDQAFVHSASVHSCFSAHTCPFLVDSCNGLLLYGTRDGVSWTYHVSRSDFNHAVALPPAHSVNRLVYTSLLLYGSCYDKFKIMCLFLDEVDCDAGTIQCTLFDSNICKWRECEAGVVNSRLVSRQGFVRGECFRPSVYSRRRLYCIWSLCLLIYDDENGSFKLIQLPEDSIISKSVKKNNNADHRFQLLWEAEGQLHFCAPAPNNQGFCIWAYVNDDDDDDNDFMDHNLMWKFKKFVMLEDSLVSGPSRKRIQPVAFNEDLQRLYVLVMRAGVIASYSFETQYFEKVWSFGVPGDTGVLNIFSFLLGSTSQM